VLVSGAMFAFEARFPLTRALRSRPVPFAAAVFLAVSALLCVVARKTPSDIDEGYFATAFELVAKGKVLYRDFFYPQGPLLPYLMAPFWALLHPTLATWRAVMAVVAGATAALVAARTYEDTSSRTAGICAAAFIAFHELGWQWLTAVKAYGVSSLLLTGALLCATTRAPKPRSILLLAGALATGAISVRLLVAPVVPMVVMAATLRHTRAPVVRGAAVFLLCLAAVFVGTHGGVAALALAALAILLVDSRWRLAARDGGYVVLGCILGLLPAVLLYAVAPAQFVFGNVGYHQLRGASSTLFGAWEENRQMLYDVIGIHEGNALSACGTQFSILVVFSVLGVCTSREPHRRLPWLCAAVLCAVMDLTPNGVHEQYFATSIPSFALCASGLLGDIIKDRRGLLARVGAVCVAVYYMIIAWPSFERKHQIGMYDVWDMSSARPKLIDDVSKLVREAEKSAPGPILTTWPGYAMGSAEHIMSGYENHFARWVADKVPEPDRRTLKLRTVGDFMHDLANRQATVLVLGRELERTGGDGTRALAVACGYRPFGRSTQGAEVYVRSAVPGPGCR
jgi:4-amino-4-deoxy-L-arabinose transferase-like glycosyltransferase